MLFKRHSIRKFHLKIFVLSGNFAMNRHWGKMQPFYSSNAFAFSGVTLQGSESLTCKPDPSQPKLKQITYISVWIWDKKGIYLPETFSMGLNSTLGILDWLFHLLNTCICSFFPHMVVHTHKQKLPLATGYAEDAAHPGISDLLTLNFLAQKMEIVFVFLSLCSKKGLGKLKYYSEYYASSLFRIMLKNFRNILKR